MSLSEHFCFHELGEVAFFFQKNRHQVLLKLCKFDLSCVCPKTLSVCKGPRNLLSLEYKKNKQILDLCIVCFWTGLLCSNWLCQTEELDEAQTNCGLFI